jgi:hypothetical protein
VAGVAEVKSFEREGDDEPPFVKLDRGGGELARAAHYEPAGYDSQPLPSDTVALGEDAEEGNELVVGYHDSSGKKAGVGEVRIYARDASGRAVTEIWCKADGSIAITSLLAPSGGKIEVGADGSINLNGVIVDAQGNLSAPGEVSARAATPATAVNLSTHPHPTALGPSGPPTPGV